jgi:hypothetical protein
MSALKRLWTRIARFAEALDGVGDTRGDYMVSLGQRVDQLEHEVEHLETQLRLRGGIQQQTKAQTTFTRDSSGPSST